jgi:hypothetical protein
MTLVNDAARAVAVEEVDSEEQCLREELEGGMGFDEEVEEVWAHEPLDLSLDVD